MKKRIFILSFIALISLLMGCGESSDRVTRTRIASNCNGTTCSFSLADNEIVRYTTILGQSKERTLRSTPLNAENGTEITWSIEASEGKYLDKSSMMNMLGLPPCKDNACNESSYPNTGIIFNDSKPHTVSVRGTVVKEDGSIVEIDETKHVEISLGKPEILIESIDHNSNEYTFAAELDHLGLAEGEYTLNWSAGESSTPFEGETFTHSFTVVDAYDPSHEMVESDNIVKLTVVPQDPNLTPVSVEKIIKLGELNPPKIQVNSVNGKSISVAVDTSSLPNNTIYMWGVEGQLIDASGLSANLNLPKYHSKYNIVLTAKTPNNKMMLKTIKEVTTGYGKPSIVVNNRSSLQYQFIADIAGTGISKSNTIYKWTVNGMEFTTKDPIEITFPANSTNSVKLEIFTDGKLISTVEETITVGKDKDHPNLTIVKGSSPLKYIITANFVDRPNGTLTASWFINGKKISGENAKTLNYEFPYADKAYIIKFEASWSFKDDSSAPIVEESPIVKVAVGSVGIPKVTMTPQKYYKTIDISADLSNTGIKDTWTLEWEFPEGFTVNNQDKLKANVTSSEWDVSKDFKLIATPPAGTGEKAVEYKGKLTVAPMPYVTKATGKFPNSTRSNVFTTLDSWMPKIIKFQNHGGKWGVSRVYIRWMIIHWDGHVKMATV